MAHKRANKHKGGHPHAGIPDRHPHYANHRSAGHAVGEEHNADASPRPGKHIFDAGEEQAMRQPSQLAGGAGGDPAEPDADDLGGLV